MPKLSSIQRETTKEVVIPFDDETLTMTIVPSKVTVGWQRKASELSKANDLPGIADLFFSVVKDWDLTDDAGAKIPLDASGTDQLSIEVFVGLMDKMVEAQRPNDETTSNS